LRLPLSKPPANRRHEYARYCLTKLLGNEAVKSYITRHEPEILEHYELVVNIVSMEQAVLQQLEADSETGPIHGHPALPRCNTEG
jgi:hypothetical protein